jgi:hypothetical protein
MRKGDVWSIILLLGVLAFAVVIVDERWLRVAVAFLPTLLLVQRAVTAGREEAEREVRVGAANRRVDDSMRSAVDDLLKEIREFYLTCHLLGSGRMSADEAVEKTSRQEKELNRLLARVTDTARARHPAQVRTPS